MSKNDRFANIAAAGISTEGKGLVTHHVRKDCERVLPMSLTGAVSEVFNTRKSPEDEVAESLLSLRKKYEPFLKRFVPEPDRDIKAISLSEFDWRVATIADERDFNSVVMGGGEWTKVSIPHYGAPVGNAETIYRTVFKASLEELESRAAFIHFDGVDYIAEVYINGKLVGRHEGFFAPFEFDCTDCLKDGENILVVCVKNDFVMDGKGDKIYAATGPGYDDPLVGWHHCPPAMGIYQPVRFEIRPRQFLGDVFVRPLSEREASGQKAEANAAADSVASDFAELNFEVYSADNDEVPASFKISVYGSNFEQTVFEDMPFCPNTGRAVGMGDTFTIAQLNAANLLEKPVDMPLEKGRNFYRVVIPMKDHRVWTPDEPYLYEARISLLDKDGRVIDRVGASFGMRGFRMDTESEKKGRMYLNGKEIRLRGANTMGFEQQDVMRGDIERLIDDMLLAKVCNMNFLRITQRPVQDEIYSVCDRIGLLIQTDLPMFGVLRRNQLAEAVRQAGEMEHLVRNHPCCIIDTYINEPFPNANNKPQRNLSRPELMMFFDMADMIVHTENPDRVTKHVDGDYDPPSKSLPDNHCYTCWYNGHGIDAGALNKGDWLPVKDGWYYGCGEFGAEGLENVSVMRKYYPESWLPQSADEEKTWSPSSIIRAQTGNFHYFFYETPDSLDEWVYRSQEYQAEATKWMTEAYRRNADMVTFALHLFIDAFPSGWMKTIVDVDRNIKPAFFAYRDALTQVMTSLRTDRYSYFAGESASVEVWLCSDKPEPVDGAKIVYEAALPNGKIVSGEYPCSIGGCGAAYVGELRFDTGDVDGKASIRCALVDKNGTVLHIAHTELSIIDVKTPKTLPNVFVPDGAGRASALAEILGLSVAQAENADVMLFDDYGDYAKDKEKFDSLARDGKKLIFIDLPAGEYEFADENVKISESSMLPMHFANRNTGHRWVAGFDRKAFRNWYSRAEDRITPILERTFFDDRFVPVLTSGNTDSDGNWKTAQAVGELRVGKGSVVVCGLKLDEHVADNPVAKKFAYRMLCD